MLGALLLDVGIALVTWLLAYLLAHPRNPWQILDRPNARSLHARPMPRMGGLAVGAGVLLGGFVGFGHLPARLLIVIGAFILLAMLSFYDDVYGLSPRIRLLGHGLVAFAVANGYVRWPVLLLPHWAVPLGGPLAVVLMALFLMWWINLYNFMDGMDGLAGGMAVFGFGTLALLGLRAHDPSYAEVGFLVASAALGFTVSNFPPARLFMGDAGATTLGLGAGVMILAGAQRGDFPLWVGLIVFSPFLVDATLTLLLRIARGENPTVAHRSHYYQRLVRLGLGHRRVVLAEYLLMTICAACAYGSVGRSDLAQWLVLVFLLVLYVMLAGLVSLWETWGNGNGKASC